MSKATKRKIVQNESLNDFDPPTPDQQIVKILSGKGNNLHEVLTADGETFLASMPTKFRRNLWAKRGDFVVTEPIEEGDKVKAEIVRILNHQQIKYFKKDGVWPEQFNDDSKKEEQQTDEYLFENTNRRVESDSDTDSDCSDSDSDDGDER